MDGLMELSALELYLVAPHQTPHTSNHSTLVIIFIFDASQLLLMIGAPRQLDSPKQTSLSADPCHFASRTHSDNSSKTIFFAASLDKPKHGSPRTPKRRIT